MSYDIWMEADLGGREPAMVSESINYTSNVSGMWDEAMKNANGICFDPDDRMGWGLRWVDGKTGNEAIPKLLASVEWMRENREILETMNPENGWGDYEGAVEYVVKLLEMAERTPKAIFRVSC